MMMTLSTKGILERLDDEFRQQNIDFFLEQKKKKAEHWESERSFAARLEYLESEVRKLKEQLTASHSKD